MSYFIDKRASVHNRENLKLGENASINEFCFIDAAGGIEIGDNSRIAPMVSIISQEHNFQNTCIPVWQQGFKKAKVIIGKDCWIGTQSTILTGAKLADGTIIGANSLVLKNTITKPYTIYAGNPIKEIGKRGGRNKNI